MRGSVVGEQPSSEHADAGRSERRFSQKNVLMLFVLAKETPMPSPPKCINGYQQNTSEEWIGIPFRRENKYSHTVVSCYIHRNIDKIGMCKSVNSFIYCSTVKSS